jgi:hypothetical protein
VTCAQEKMQRMQQQQQQQQQQQGSHCHSNAAVQ